MLQLGDEEVNKDRLYRALDHLLAHKAALEVHLSQRCGELFAVQNEVLLYDITSTYFEGQAEANPLLQDFVPKGHVSRFIVELVRESLDLQEIPGSYMSGLGQPPAEKAGLVKLGHVALDGTKIKANASKHKAMSYARMKQRDAELQAEVDRWLAAAQAADAEEDALHGSKRGEEMPKWVADKQKRIEKIREAKAELEAEAKASAEEERRIKAEAEEQRIAEGRKKRPGGKPDKPITDDPDPKAQRNFTDPESRIMKTKDGYIQGYNAQAAVDGCAQIIVAHGLIQTTSDHGQVVPLVDGIESNLGRKPAQASADNGYLSETNLEALSARGVDGYIATGRAKHPTADNGKVGGPLTQAMRKKIADGGFETPYRLRKQIVEAVFGQIKQARGFRQFLLRGVENVRAEWTMICLAHNLTKLANAA